MITSYWEMAATMVLHGAVNEELFLDTQAEIVFHDGEALASSARHAREDGLARCDGQMRNPDQQAVKPARKNCRYLLSG